MRPIHWCGCGLLVLASLGSAARAADTPPDDAVRGRYAAALAEGDLGVLADLAAAHPDLGLDAAALSQRVEAERGRSTRPPLDELVAAVDAAPHTPRLAEAAHAAVGPFAAIQPDQTAAVKKGVPLRLAAAPGHFASAHFTAGDTIRDFDWELAFTVRPRGKEHPTWTSQFTVAVYDADAGVATGPEMWQGRGTLVGVGLMSFENGTKPRARVHFDRLGVTPSFPLPALKLDGRTTHTLRLARRGADALVLLDGEPLARVPLMHDAPRPVFHLHAVGLDVNITAHRLDELAPPAP